LHEYLKDFPGRRDELRYVLTSISPETKDSDFTWKDYQQKVNSELVAILGNFVNRVMVLTWKYFDGKVPSEHELPGTTERRKKILDHYNKAHGELNVSVKEMISALNDFRFREAQFQLMNMARIGNKFLADTEPWKLAKEDMEAVGCILNYAITLVGNIAIACDPFLPDAAASLRKQLNSSSFEANWKQFWINEELINSVPQHHQLGQPELLYKNVEDDEIDRQVKKLRKTEMENEQPASAVKPLKSQITIDDFAKLDIRVGKVLAAEKMEKSNKLLKLTVDTGVDQRTVLSGIAQHYSPEEMVGKQVTLIANLAPRKMMGIESQGMILMAEDVDGKLRLLQPNEVVTPGSTIS
jgi:methionyl-tRNA synthetase